VRILNLIDESTRECLLIRTERRWSSAKVIGALADVMVWKGVPEHLRSDNGPEFVAKNLRKWLADTGAQTLYIEPGSPWENGYCESSNSKLRNEFLNGELFYSIKELRVLAERWRVHYNTVRPHSSLGYRPPAPEAWRTSTTPIAQLPEACREQEFRQVNSRVLPRLPRPVCRAPEGIAQNRLAHPRTTGPLSVLWDQRYFAEEAHSIDHRYG
jgi:hypothetical protein